MLGLHPDLLPRRDQVDRQIDVRHLDVPVGQRRPEAIGIAGLRQQALGLTQIGGVVSAEARELFKLRLAQRPLALRVHDAPDQFQVGDRGKRLDRIVAIDGQGQGLAHPLVVEGLLARIDRDAKSADALDLGRYDLVAQLLLDGVDVHRGKKAQFHIDATRSQGRGPGRGVGDDEVREPIQVGQPLLPVVGVALQLDVGAPHVGLQLEGPAPDGLGLEVVGIPVQILLRVDEVGRVGQTRHERRRGVVQAEDHGEAVGSLDALDHLIVPAPRADHAPRGKDHLVPAGLDVHRGQLAAIVELDPLVQGESIAEVAVQDLPGLGDIPDDLGIVVRVQDEQVVVDSAHRLGHREGLLLVRVQAGRVGGQGHPQDPSAARLFLGDGRRRGPKAHEHHDGQENHAYPQTSHRRFSFLVGEKYRDHRSTKGLGGTFPAQRQGKAVRSTRAST